MNPNRFIFNHLLYRWGGRINKTNTDKNDWAVNQNKCSCDLTRTSCSFNYVSGSHSFIEEFIEEVDKK